MTISGGYGILNPVSQMTFFGGEMDSNFSPNFTEYVYDKKAEGNLLVGRVLLVLLYIIFVVGFFLFCYISRIIPLFALCPFATWVLVFFTWRLVSFDVYYTFEHAKLEVGKMRDVKNARIKLPSLVIECKNVTYVARYSDAVASGKLGGVKLKDFSQRLGSYNSIVILYNDGGETCAVVIEATDRLIKLLKSFVKDGFLVS